MSAPPSPLPPRERAGRALDFVGQSLFPITLGLVGGFYASDRGLRWLPDMLQLVLAVCVASLLLMGAGWWLRGRVITGTAEGIKLRKRVIAGVVIATLALVAQLFVYFSQEPSPLTSIPAETLSEAFVLDAERLREYDVAMESMLQRLEASDMLASKADRVLSAEEEALLRDCWAGLRRYGMALDELRIFYEDYWRFDISRTERAMHLRSFLLTFAAEASLYEKAARFTSLAVRNPSAMKFLDAPHPGLGLPANTFSLFRQELLGTRDLARIIAGKKYLLGLDKGFGARAEATAMGFDPVWRRLERHLRRIDALSTTDQTNHTLKADGQILKRGLRRVWFPAQKNIAEWTGDTRVRRIGWYLVDQKLQQEIDGRLEPGDIMLSRKNWYLSNVGLPGFWPHGLIYMGDPQKFADYFNDPAVDAWVQAQGTAARTFPQWLALQHAEHWAHYQQGHEGEPYRVLEAISEGVVFNTMDHAAGDYLVALRPRLDKLAKAQAIAEAFTYLGRPYDFDFDFATDHALVCTEVVWRMYRPAEGKAGLEIPLKTVAGRRTLPANEIARLFSQQLGTPQAQLDYVVFVDALEKERRAFISTEEEFKTTWERPQWDTSQR